MQACTFYFNNFSIRFISKEKGFGVFSNVSLKSGSVIDYVMPHKMSKLFTIFGIFFIKFKFLFTRRIITNIFKYLGFDNKRHVFHICPTMFNYCNHSRVRANIAFNFNYDTQIYTIVAIKDINVGDEILLEYKSHNFYYKD